MASELFWCVGVEVNELAASLTCSWAAAAVCKRKQHAVRVYGKVVFLHEMFLEACFTLKDMQHSLNEGQIGSVLNKAFFSREQL